MVTRLAATVSRYEIAKPSQVCDFRQSASVNGFAKRRGGQERDGLEGVGGSVSGKPG